MIYCKLFIDTFISSFVNEQAFKIHLLKQKLKEAVSKIKRIQGLEEAHLKNNGDLRVHIVKLEKQVHTLKNVLPDIQAKA